MKKKTKKKIIKKRLVKKRPPAWIRVSGGSTREPTIPKTKIPKGEYIDNNDYPSKYDIRTYYNIPLGIEEHAKRWLSEELDEISNALLEGKEVVAYEQLESLQKELLFKGNVLKISKHYDKDTETNQIKKLTYTALYIDYSKVKKEKEKKNVKE